MWNGVSQHSSLQRVFEGPANVSRWPMAVLDPEPTYTTDGHQVVQSNDGIIGIPRGVKERTFIATLAPYSSAETGI